MKILKRLFFLLLLIGCADGNKSNSGTSHENFHLYLLLGQSNMAGRGAIEAMDTLTHPRVLMFDSLMKWKPAKNPLHFDKPMAGTGLGLSFGKAMAHDNPNIKIGLIPCAKGGSSIDEWFRDSLHRQTNSYPYNEMIERAKTAAKTGTLKGILWHQGESDTGSEDAIEAYPSKFNALLDSIQKDLKLERQIPVVIGELGYFRYDKRPLSEQLNAFFATIASTDERIMLVSAKNLNHKGDSTHFDSKSLRALGKRYADAVQMNSDHQK